MKKIIFALLALSASMFSQTVCVNCGGLTNITEVPGTSVTSAVPIVVPLGSTSSASIQPTGAANTGLYFSNANSPRFVVAGNISAEFGFSSGGNINLNFGSNASGFYWGTSSQGTSGALVMPVAGTVRVQGASNASGLLLFSQSVSAKTSAYPVVVLDSGTVFTNTGAAGSVAFTLPASPTVGLTYTFIVNAAQNIVVTANSGQTIRNGGSTSSSGGTATNNVVGSAITIVALTTTTWFVTSTPIGTWTLA